MEINLLFFDGCPSWQQGLKNLHTALAIEGIQAEIRLVKVENETSAERIHFLGSPSYQINGIDLWPENRQSYGLSCRVYATPFGIKGVPTVDMLREKLRAVSTNQENFQPPIQVGK